MAEDLESFITGTAVRAGELIKNMRVNATATAQTKTSAVDVVTEADHKAEQLITKLITTTFPFDSVLGEEGGLSVPGESGVTWIIDPIDGTTNYVYGLSASCVSIAATVTDDLESRHPSRWVGEPSNTVRRTIAAAVYNPFTDELFSALEGGGAKLNGSVIQINDDGALETALVATGFGYTAQRRQEQAEILLELLPRVRDIRRIGSAAYDLCLLASGRLDAYYERGIQEWDFAAGVLIATEAGAVISGTADGALPGTNTLIAGHPELTIQLQEIVSLR